MSVHLKIKSKHLAAEAKIIKLEEMKLKRLIKFNTARQPSHINNLNELVNHRKGIVRSVSRSTHLAYGFVKGTKYRKIEDNRTRTAPNWKEVERMIVKYSGEDQRITKQKFAEWKAVA